MKKPAIYYGWFVVAACFIVTLTLGETFWSFGVFFKPLENEFGWSRAVTSSGYTAFTIGYAISTVVSGRLADRYSPRPIIFVTALISGLGIALCSQVNNIQQLCIFLFIAGLGGGATMSVPSATVQRWFHNRRKAGLALAIVISGVGVGALIFAPLINFLILSYGWRNAYLIVGILFFISIAIAAFVIKSSPAESRAIPGVGVDMTKEQSDQGWTISKAIVTPAFISVVFLNLATVLGFQVVTVHLIPYATDIGISATAAAAALGLMGGFSIPGRLTSGFLAEKVGWQRIMALSFLGMALSLSILLFLRNTWMMYGFVMFYGICHGARATTQFGILGKFFGMHSLGVLIGIMMGASHSLGSFAPYIAGFIFDTTGNYLTAFILVMVVLLGASFISATMKAPSVTPE